ncbi:hypothetical protein KFE25_009463 [Diacronema lutheri]|uniref:Alkaline ceramidase n=1 Tax=Diacronema lutheri TaxID=2081491 RepID=A0A8J5XYB7_DIALT|nr:hypothetical protein KFE25_009463 [Diacronema lutheri]
MASHVTTGFWGSPTALHTFCEPKYAPSYFFAEMFNSISSLIFCAAAIYLLVDRDIRADLVVVLLAVALFIIGLGSAAFHATMLWEYELWDELPMLVFVALALLSKAACLPRALQPYRAAYVSAVTLATCGSAAAYVLLKKYDVFVHSFTLIVFVDLAVGSAQPAESRAINWFKLMTALTLAAGKALWEVEVRLCAVEPRVWVLHVAWHVLACASAYCGILCNFLFRVERGLNPHYPHGTEYTTRWSAGQSDCRVLAGGAREPGRATSKDMAKRR